MTGRSKPSASNTALQVKTNRKNRNDSLGDVYSNKSAYY